METLVKDVLSQAVTVTRGGKRRRIPAEQAMLLRLAEMGLSGDLQAMRLLLALGPRTCAITTAARQTLLRYFRKRILRSSRRPVSFRAGRAVMSGHEQRLLNALLRQDLHSFVMKAFATTSPGETFLPNWHLRAICHHLELVRAGRIRRLKIEVPPRSLKSVCASVAFPAFVLGHDPTAKIITVSYSGDLAAKHAADCRAIMHASWYRDLFPQTRISAAKNQEANYETTQRGYRYATSVGGTLTGRGGNLIIIDDPLKPEDAMSQAKRDTVNAWYSRTLLSRLNNKARDAIVLVQQRVGGHDDGDVAAQLAVDAYLDVAAAQDDPERAVRSGMAAARQAVGALRGQGQKAGAPSSTLVGLALKGASGFVGQPHRSAREQMP
jgi:hypothetical protein